MSEPCRGEDCWCRQRRPIVTDTPEQYGLPPYPKGNVVGPCVCGSWPGGKCLKCSVLLPPPPPSTIDRRLTDELDC